MVILVAEDPAPGETIDLVSFDLVRQSGSNVWTGEFVLATTTSVVEFRVQAVDQAGNVGYASNKTEGYPATVASDPVVTSLVVPSGGSGLVDLADGVEATVEFTDPTGVFDEYDVEFDWGDGTTSGAFVDPPTATNPGTATARRTYAAPGRYDVSVAVTDRAGGTSTFATEVVVVDPDAAPVIADVVLDDLVAVGDEIDLSGTFSDGSAPLDTHTVTIDWGDGTDDSAAFVPPPFAQDSAPFGASHTYGAIGVYDVVVSVFDGRNTTSETRTVIVTDPTASPVITAGPLVPALEAVGNELTVTTEFTDGSAPSDTFTARVDWGDGSIPETVDVEEPAGPLDPGSVTAPKSYEQPGNYVVTVEIVDRSGTRVSASSAEIRIYDPDAPPVITPIAAPTEPQLITDGVNVSAEFTDQSMPNDGPFLASIDWGDGTAPQDGAVTPPTADGTGGSVSVPPHFYAKRGVYTVTISVTDGNDLNTTTETVEVEVVAPVGTPVVSDVSVPDAPTSNAAPIEITATFTDASGPYEDYTATIDWGDGTETMGTVEAPTADGPGTVSGSHEYAEAGTYTVTVTVLDENRDEGTLESFALVIYDTNAAPRFLMPSVSSSSVLVDEPVTVTAEFTDASLPEDGPFTATIDWGDGNGQQVVDDVVQATLESAGSITVTNSYAATGTKQVLITVVDADGNATTAMLAVTVEEPTGVTITGDIEGPTTPQLITDGVTIGASFDGNPSATFTATVDWGDGEAPSSAGVTIDVGAGRIGGPTRLRPTGCLRSQSDPCRRHKRCLGRQGLSIRRRV